MPLRKKNAMRRGRGRRRAYRPRATKSRQGVNPSYHAPKNFCETIKFKDVIAGVSGPGNGIVTDLSLSPNNLPLLDGYLAQIYRQFCIRGIKITYEPAYNDYAQIPGVTQAPKIYMVEDKTAAVLDSSSVNLDNLLTQDNARVLSPFRRWTSYVKFPKPLMLSTSDAVGGGSVPELTVSQLPSNRPMWLSCQTQTNMGDMPGLSVPHLVGRLVTENTSSPTVAVTLGKLYYKVYYSVKEQGLAQALAYTPPSAQ